MTSEVIRRRSELLAKIRQFFGERGFTEVTTPLIDPEIIPEAHIDPFEVPGLGYLQASPEMHLKRLLCAGSGPIFEIAKCFRRDENGPLHRPEFTMIEWYRPGDEMQAGIALLEEFLHWILDTPPAKRTTYSAAFEAILGFDPVRDDIDFTSSEEDPGFLSYDHDENLNYLLAKMIEPTLGIDVPEILYYYPETQAALAETTIVNDGRVAERFELYYRGIELANGYHELTRPAELRERLEEVNRKRTNNGRIALPLPEKMLSAMENPGLPACAGVALGFDRLLMLELGAESLDELGI